MFTSANNSSAEDYDMLQLIYINIPQFSLFAARHGYKVNCSLKEDQSLHSLGLEVNHLLIDFSDLLEKTQLYTRELPALNSPDGNLIGCNFRFDDRFRTKNMPSLKPHGAHANLSTDDVKHIPHIYKKIGEWKLIIILEPKWVTTSHAHVMFTPLGGHRRFEGLCKIETLDFEVKCIYATPIVLGVQESKFNDIFY
jgi:hypothetical protein